MNLLVSTDMSYIFHSVLQKSVFFLNTFSGLMRMLIVEPDLITDNGYLEHVIKFAINCGVIDQWKLARTHGFPPNEDMEEEMEPDPNGIRSISEREYCTLNQSVS